jgi:hypothetical protein
MAYITHSQKDIMANKASIPSIITACFCLFIQSPSFAGVYKWVDENGQVHYGEKPMSADAEKVTIRQNETTKPRTLKKVKDEADKDTAAENPDSKDGEETANKTPEPVEPTISKKEKRKLCNQAKSNVAAITSRGRMREINEKGEYNYLSDKQRQQRLAAAKKQQREYCR